MPQGFARKLQESAGRNRPYINEPTCWKVKLTFLPMELQLALVTRQPRSKVPRSPIRALSSNDSSSSGERPTWQIR